MEHRYIIHGKDAATGQAVRKVIEAGSAAEAESIAARIGVQVAGSELERDPAARVEEISRSRQGQIPDVAEEPVWSGTPSQWTNFWWFVACVLLLPIPVAIHRYLRVRTTRYILTNQRLRLETGIVSRRIEEVELYRVNDSAAHQGVFERLLGIGTVWLQTTDARNPEVVLEAVPRPADLRERIRSHGEARRRWRRVAEIEVQ